MKKYLHIYLLGFKNALEYRGALLTWILDEFLIMTSALFLWTGLFTTNNQVGTYSYSQIILYYYLIPVVGAFTALHISDKLPQKIKNGEISKDLIRPYNYLFGFITNQFAIKTIQNTLKIPIYIFVGFFLFFRFNLSLNPTNILTGIIAIMCGLIFHAVFDTALSLVAFWFDDTWSLSLIKYVLFMIFGGVSFPLDMIPAGWKWLYQILPFDLVYYFPVSMIIGKLSPMVIGGYLFKWLIWIIVCLISTLILWSRGIRKYAAYGQ